MKRSARKHESPLREVQKINLSERHKKVRFILMIVFAVIALAAFSVGVLKLLTTEEGWRDIETNSKAQTVCAQEFSFQYHLGASDLGATAEYKLISEAYTQATDLGYMLFTNESFPEHNNIYYLNRHVNQPVQVEAPLYEAFELLQDSRYLYLAPVYEQYRGLFSCTNDSDTVYFDPYQNEEIRTYFGEILTFAHDPEAVQVKLLGNSTVELYVSDAYQAYAQENGITEYLDFFWLRNAFILDYTAKSLSDAGYRYGTISSFDGFSATLGEENDRYSFNLFDRIGQTVYQAASVEYTAPANLVYFRNFRLSAMDEIHYYELENGEIRTPYVNLEDGLCKSSVNDFVGISSKKSCAEIALELLPLFASEEFDPAALQEKSETGIDTIYCDNAVIISTDPGLGFSDLYAGESVQYEVKK